MVNKVCEKFQALDIFGHPIGVNYKGNDTFQTKMGAFFTLVVYSLIIINLITLSTDFIAGTKQEEKNGLIYFDRFFDRSYNFQENHLEIEVLPSLNYLIPADYGSFKAHLRRHRKGCG